MNALKITGHTLLGVGGEPPHSSGNCFSVEADDKREYRIVNFVYENFHHVLKQGVSWPVKIKVLRDHIAVIHDSRIPDEWYMARFCEVCCADDLLPVPQILAHERQEERGERIDMGHGWIKIDWSKRPKLEESVAAK